MQQSIRILKYGSEDLHNFLSNVELENPFMIVNASHSYVTGGLDHQNEHDIAEFAVEKKSTVVVRLPDGSGQVDDEKNADQRHGCLFHFTA